MTGYASQQMTTVSSERLVTNADLCLAMVRARFDHTDRSISLPPDFDAHSLLAFAGKQGVATALSGGVKRAGVEGSYATGFKLMLEALEISNSKRNQTLRSDLRHIGNVLTEAEISCVALKGGAFIAEDPNAAPWRMASDLDVLVEANQLQSAAKLLRENGYQLAWEEELYRQEDHQHFPALVNLKTRTSLELHTRALWDPGRDPLETAEVLSDSIAIPKLEGMRIPSPEHRMMHLVAHCQISDKHYPARRILLKDVLDLAMLCQQHEIDWTKVETSFARIERLPELIGFLSASEKLLRDAAPELPLELETGSSWANKAITNYRTQNSDRSRMALDLVKDYAGRILLRRGGISLMMKTIFSPTRLRNLLHTHYTKWRG